MKKKIFASTLPMLSLLMLVLFSSATISNETNPSSASNKALVCPSLYMNVNSTYCGTPRGGITTYQCFVTGGTIDQSCCSSSYTYIVTNTSTGAQQSLVSNMCNVGVCFDLSTGSYTVKVVDASGSDSPSYPFSVIIC